jgi:aspartyl-tRNA(Asn)/glutamyl-tRNA(Gln) amidotransferase subunit C
MQFDAEAIEHLAKLAKIRITPAENESLQKDVSAIMGLMTTLETLDTTGVEPTSQVTGLLNVTRADEANYTFAKEDIVATMPDTDDDGNLRVKSVFVDHKDAR